VRSRLEGRSVPDPGEDRLLSSTDSVRADGGGANIDAIRRYLNALAGRVKADRGDDFKAHLVADVEPAIRMELDQEVRRRCG
jgi:hypothetical protein